MMIIITTIFIAVFIDFEGKIPPKKIPGFLFPGSPLPGPLFEK